MWEIHGKKILKYLLLPTLLKINKFTAVLLNRTIVKQATLSTATVSRFYNQMLDHTLLSVWSTVRISVQQNIYWEKSLWMEYLCYQTSYTNNYSVSIKLKYYIFWKREYELVIDLFVYIRRISVSCFVLEKWDNLTKVIYFWLEHPLHNISTSVFLITGCIVSL